nr:DUF4430 domain-containing protein [Candidatus Njordarchaeota archaeon]
MNHGRTAVLLAAVLLPASGLVVAYVYFWGLGGAPLSGAQVYGTLGPCYNVTVIISYGSGYDNQTFTDLNFPNGTTVFDALREVANVTYKYYGSLVLVTGINGVTNNASLNMFWQYHVNGVFGPVASNMYHLANNSVVVWGYQPSRFT